MQGPGARFSDTASKSLVVTALETHVKTNVGNFDSEYMKGGKNEPVKY